MLEPRDRLLMFDALRPPVGYRFDQGIGTTYSMDLLAMLLAPVAFTFFDQRQSEDGPAHSSLEVLESLRRHADRMTVYCEAGRIAVPRGRYPQLAFIEQSLLQCRPPEGGSFHPKLWVLRFVGKGPTRYRVLCLTRKLLDDFAIVRPPTREGLTAAAIEDLLNAFRQVTGWQTEDLAT